MTQFVLANQTPQDKVGRTLPKARLYFYDNNTFNFKDVYSDIGLTSVLPNPVIADGKGRFPVIYMDPSLYRVWLKNRHNKQVTPFLDDQTGSGGISPDLPTVIDAQAANLTVGTIITTAGYYATNDGGGGDYIVVAGGTGPVDGGTFVDMLNGNQLWLIANGSITFNVPSDISSLTSAITYAQSLNFASNIIINLDSGYRIESGYAFIDKDYSNITITSQDATVLTHPSISWVDSSNYETSSGDIAGSPTILFLGLKSKLPTFNIIVDLESKTTSQGINIGVGSIARIGDGFGFINAGGTAALSFSGSLLVANGSLFNDATDNGVWVSSAGTASIQRANCNDCGGYGVLTTRSSKVEFSDGTAQRCGVRGVRSSSGSSVEAQRANVDGSNVGIQARTGGVCDFSLGTALNCVGFALDANEEGVISADGVTASSSAGIAVSASKGGRIIFDNGGAAGFSADIQVSRGGIVNATNSTGVYSQVSNFLSGDGCIFDSSEPSDSGVIITTSANGVSRRYPDGLLIMERDALVDFTTTGDQIFNFPDTPIVSRPSGYLTPSFSSSATYRGIIRDSLVMTNGTSWVLSFGTTGAVASINLRLTCITTWK